MSDQREEAFVFVTHNEQTGQDEHFVSLVRPDSAFERGLPLEAIMGKLVAGPEAFEPESFAENPRFVEFLHAFIARHAANCPALMAEARRQHDGNVFVIDGRTPTPAGEVPPYDVIGAVEVSGGAVIRYHANPNYKVFAASGLTQLDPWLHERLILELENLEIST